MQNNSVNEKQLRNRRLRKRMVLMLICLSILFGGIFLSKVFEGFMMKKYFASMTPVMTVSSAKVGYSWWNTKLKASGSLRAVRGVNVTTELAGLVETIYFTPGANVREGDVLVQLKAASDKALLESLQANLELSKTVYERDKAQYAAQAISKATLDADSANMKSLQAQVDQQAAIVAKKTIRAPFAGRLGISKVNPGQYVNAGDKIVTLQQMDPIYVDFYVPQQDLLQLRVGQNVDLHMEMFPNKSFVGKITTIDPLVDVNTRNAEIEATLSNPQFELVPGMFAPTEVTVGEPLRYLTLPQTAVSYNPYGDVVFLVKQEGKDQKGQPVLTVSQVFVTTGPLRGDQVAILKGIKEGDEVVTSGQLKLKNGSRIAINNTVVPQNNPAPKITDY